MARPRSFRNPTRVSLTLNRETLLAAGKIAGRPQRSVSETEFEILNDYFHENGHGLRPGTQAHRRKVF